MATKKSRNAIAKGGKVKARVDAGEKAPPPPTPAAKANAKKGWGNPLTFLSQVRAEVAKVVWPTRRETGISTAFVLVFVFLASIFFLAVDWVLKYLTGLLFS